MTARTIAATAFVTLFEFLRDTIGIALALADRALQAARRDYLFSSIGEL